MGFVAIKDENFHCIASVAVEEEFKDVFSDKLLRVASLQLKHDAIPAVMANGRVPVLVRHQLKAELKRLTKLDTHELNKAFIQEHYTMPILEDVLHDIKYARIFTKADLSYKA